MRVFYSISPNYLLIFLPPETATGRELQRPGVSRRSTISPSYFPPVSYRLPTAPNLSSQTRYNDD